MKNILQPKIEMFSPFKEPFSEKQDETYNDYNISKIVIVSPEVVGYMKDKNTKIVAKCTPCQCCACR